MDAGGGRDPGERGSAAAVWFGEGVAVLGDLLLIKPIRQ